jgi:uracil-DNA glycosylase
MGLKPGRATGAMPSVPDYKIQCQAFLDRQVEIVKPSAVIALGAKAIKYVSRLRGTHAALRHPGDWVFQERSQRDALLSAERQKLRESLRRVAAESKPLPWTIGRIDGQTEER